MKWLEDKEIEFLKKTHYSATVFQCDEWGRTPFVDFSQACRVALDEYGVNLLELNKKICNADEDAISLEFAAGYLFYIFFTKEELETMSPKDGLKFLKDFKYFFGWRKSDERDAYIAMCDAIQLHEGTMVFTQEFGDGDVWYVDAEN